MTELGDLNALVRTLRRENTCIDIKFMELRKVLEKIVLSTSHREAVAMAASVLKQVSIDHHTVKIELPPLEEPPKKEIQKEMPPPPPAKPKNKRGPKPKDTKKGAALW